MTISHAKALPTQVLISSMVCRMDCTVMRGSRFVNEAGTTKHHPVARPDGASPVRLSSDRRLGVRPEVVIERHLAVGDVVLLPAQRALGEVELRLDDLLEQRIARDVLLRDLVEQLELALEDRIRRLEKADLVLRLQRDVV